MKIEARSPCLNGAMTFSIITRSILALSIKDPQLKRHSTDQQSAYCYTECRIFIRMMRAIML
jgi:hypothetical protein